MFIIGVQSMLDVIILTIKSQVVSFQHSKVSSERFVSSVQWEVEGKSNKLGVKSVKMATSQPFSRNDREAEEHGAADKMGLQRDTALPAPQETWTMLPEAEMIRFTWSLYTPAAANSVGSNWRRNTPGSTHLQRQFTATFLLNIFKTVTTPDVSIQETCSPLPEFC